MQILANITQFSTTFPDAPKNSISRESLVVWLHDTFSVETKAIVLQGADGSGKTTLLAQFVGKFSDRCFSYFIRNDFWIRDPQNFLREMCHQMQVVVKEQPEDLSELSFDQLRSLFSKLYMALARKGKRERNPYFFVIDGLDWSKGELGSIDILSLIPKELLSGIYMLASSYPKQTFEFTHHIVTIQFFTLSDTEDYLRQIGIYDKEYVRTIYSVCNGMPGYLDQLRRELESGRSIEDITQDLPVSFSDFLEREWDRCDPRIEEAQQILALLAFANSPLSAQNLSNILKISSSSVETFLVNESFVTYKSSSEPVSFASDAHKNFVANKYAAYRHTSEEQLINYYKKDIFSATSMFNLPMLYRPHYALLQDYMSADHLMRSFENHHDLYLLRRGIKIVIDAAHQQADWQTLSKYSLFSSVLQGIGLRSVEEIEIEALVAVGKEQESLELAYGALLPEDRLNLLITNAKALKDKQSPLVPNLVDTIGNLVQQIDETDVLRSRLLEIAADLFDLHPQSAIDLVEKVTGKTPDGRAADYVLTFLALNTKKEDQGSRNDIRLRIKDQSLRDFIQAISASMVELPATDIIDEARALNDTSSRLLLLRSWCSANRKNSDASLVIAEALDIMTASSDYAVSMRHLRQLAEPLTMCNVDNLEAIVARFDVLKSTAIKHPIQETVRLELLLAAAERKLSDDKAHERLYYLYYSEISAIGELDSLCYCVIRILLSLPDIDPDDELGLTDELAKVLPERYSELIQGSAEHFEVTKEILRILTKQDYVLAAEFAEQFNTRHRRDEAYSEILKVYAESKPESLDLNFVHDLFNRIESTSILPETLIDFIDILAEINNPTLFEQLQTLGTLVEKFTDSRDICFANAFIMKAASASGSNDLVDEIYARIVLNWNKIDSIWDKVSIGFQLIPIIAVANNDYAIELLASVRENKLNSPLSESIVAELYINTILLASRTFADIGKDSDTKEDLEQLVQHINYVPSASLRCFLFSDLALRLYMIDRQQVFKQLVEVWLLKDLEYIHNQGDIATYSSALSQAAACLYQYNPSYFVTVFSQINSSYRELAAVQTIRYIISRRPSIDPADIEDGNFNVSFAQALAVCDALQFVETDYILFSLIASLTENLIVADPVKPSREKCVLFEKQALTIASKIVELVNIKLPSVKDIQHKGYLIASLAEVARLREASGNRADKNWNALVPSWDSLIAEAQTIPNLADKVLVLSSIGESIYKSNQGLGTKLIADAQEAAYQIPNVTDRADRLVGIAKTWKAVSDIDAAKFLLREAIGIARSSDWEDGRDERIGKILESIHSVDSELAASLTSSLDRPIVHQYENYAASSNLHRNPDKLPRETQYENLSKAAAELLKSLCSNRGGIMPEGIVENWINAAVDIPYSHLHTVQSWAIESNIQMANQLKYASLRNTFAGQLDCLRIIASIGAILLGDNNTASWFSTQLPAGLRLFPAGTKQEATAFLTDWLRTNCVNYLKIHDPYFSAADLWIIKAVPIDVRVSVLTTWKAQKLTPGSEEIVQIYRDAWNALSDQSPPETTLYIIGDEKDGDSPMHDRYYITDFQKGIISGTSANGLGVKDSYFRELSVEETEAEETKTIDRLMLNPPTSFKGSKLLRKIFQLS